MTQHEYDTLLEKVLSTPFIKLDVNININDLLNEYKSIKEKYSFENYNTKYWPVRKKYARSWSGICLVSSNGGLYTDMYEGPTAAAKETELKDFCPSFYQTIKTLGGEGCRSRIMRISPHESLVWHSHVQEHGQSKSLLTIQVPIIVPEKFEYCVVNKDEFKWYKRFYRPSWFKSISRKRLEAGNAYVFNSYHYHNVYNYSDEYRVTLMLYLDLRQPKIFELVKRSLND